MEKTYTVSLVDYPLQDSNVLIVHGASSKEEFDRCFMVHWFRNDWASIPGSNGNFDLAFKIPIGYALDDAIENCFYEWIDDSKQRVRRTI